MAQQEIITIAGQPVLRRVADADPCPGGSDASSTPGCRTSDLLREVAILRAAAHPGVVPIIRWETGPPPALLVSYVGVRTLDRQLHLPLWRIAAIGASVARTIADLHQRGIALRALDPESITLDGEVQPVLCDLSAATTDPSPEDRYADIAALGALLVHLVERSGTPPTPMVPGLRSASSADTGVRDALLSLADRADATCAATPWSAERLADLLDPLAAPPRSRRLERYPAAVASVAAVVGGVVLLGWPVASESDSAARNEPASIAAEVSLAVSDAAASTTMRDITSPGTNNTVTSARDAGTKYDDEAATSSLPSTGGCREDQLLAEPIGGARCLSDLRVEGATVHTPSGRFVLGDSDDVVLVDDWHCNGSPTAALLRRPEGEVYVFDSWSAPATTAAATAALVEPSVVTLTTTWTGICRLLVATRADGTSFGLTLARGHHVNHNDAEDPNP